MDQSNGSLKLPEQDQSLLTTVVRAAINSFPGDASNDTQHPVQDASPMAPTVGEAIENGNDEGVTADVNFSAIQPVAIKNPDAATAAIMLAEGNQTVGIIETMPKSLQDVPQLPLGEIMKNLDLVEILDLALSSLKLREGAVSLRLSVSSMKWIVAAPGHYVIHLVPNNGNQQRIIFKLAQNSSSNFYPACVNRKEVPIARSKSLFTVKCGSDYDENLQLLNDLTKTILQIVKVKQFNVHTNIFVEFPFIYSKRFGSFSLTGGELLFAQMKLLMEDISVDIFKLENVLFPRCSYQEFELKHRNMCLPLASWMNLQTLLASRCEKIVITPPPKQLIKPKGHVDTIEHLMSHLIERMEALSITDETEGEPTIDAFRKKIITELQELGVDMQLEGWTVERNDGRNALVSLWSGQITWELID